MPAIANLVLVVDDDAAVRRSLKFALEVEGFAVRAFAGGQELLRQPELPSCSCLVVDQNMPDMSGLDLIAALRARRLSAPAILITTHPNNQVKSRAAHAGVPIVEKPLLGGVLVDAIRQSITSAPRSTH